MKLRLFAVFSLVIGMALGQAPKAAPKSAKAAPAKAAASPVDSIIESVKAGLSDSLIIRTLKRDNKPMDLTPADLVKLKNAGVSESVIGVMLDPASNPAPAAAAAPAPEPAPAATVAAAPAPSAAITQAEKKRVIVDEFDYSAVKTSVQSVLSTQQNIGKGIRAMLVTRLAQANKVVVIERAKIATLTKEQDFNASNRVKQGKGARVGQISGADAILTGDIVIFGRDDKKRSIKGGGLFGAAIGAIAASKNQDKAVVTIDYRLIDAETSEIIATGRSQRRIRPQGQRSGRHRWSARKRRGRRRGRYDQFQFRPDHHRRSYPGLRQQACRDPERARPTNMKKSVRPVEGRVADVSGNILTLNVGGNDGVNVGETFEILRIVREVKDPVTKETLDVVTAKTGEMTITNVRDKIASGNYSGSAAQVGFMARKKIAGQ